CNQRLRNDLQAERSITASARESVIPFRQNDCAFLQYPKRSLTQPQRDQSNQRNQRTAELIPLVPLVPLCEPFCFLNAQPISQIGITPRRPPRGGPAGDRRARSAPRT